MVEKIENNHCAKKPQFYIENILQKDYQCEKFIGNLNRDCNSFDFEGKIISNISECSEKELSYSPYLLKNYYRDISVTQNNPFFYSLPEAAIFPSFHQYAGDYHLITKLPSLLYEPYNGYYHQFSRRKGGQTRFIPYQTKNLEKRFSVSKYISPEDRKHLAFELKLSEKQIKTWFQNRRAKWRRIITTSITKDHHEDDHSNCSQFKLVSETKNYKNSKINQQ